MGAAKNEKPRRPLLRWHGGKFILAKWIISHMPEHRVYVEPFGGAGSVLLQKPRAYSEVWNDVNEDLYNLFWVMRNHYSELADGLRLTPFSRREFEISHMPHSNPIEKARRLIIRSFMGFGSDSASNVARPTGFRANSNRSGSTPAHDWVNYEMHMHQLADRIRGIVLECRPALQVMASHDSAQTLFYLDPPYLESTRKGFGAYSHELSEQDHIELLDAAVNCKGAVIISGYESPLYAKTLKDWRRVERKALADGAKERTEVLWIKEPA
jgi:DNA adenine methylase